MTARFHPVAGTDVAIPAREIWFEASHAAGPGGQHVNKAATRVTLCFRPAASGALDDAAKARLARSLAARTGQDGVLRVTAGETRSQSGNRSLATERFLALLAAALRPRPRRRPTRPTAASRQRRLAAKAAASARKRSRTGPAVDPDGGP